MSMSRQATGYREHRDGDDYVVFERTFRAPIADVWAAVTEPERLERWIGTWTGDPTSGEVVFRMTAEGEDVAPEIYRIEVCEPPRHLRTRSFVPEAPGEAGEGRAGQSGPDQQEWTLDLVLTEDAGMTTLRFAQAMVGPVHVAEVGPGWEYYLDRLVAAESGGDIEAIDFEADYYPAMSEHYRAVFGEPIG